MMDNTRNENGRFAKGHCTSPETQFKKGTHWRSKKPFWDKAWLEAEYLVKKRSSGEIAQEYQVTDAAILFWLKKHKINRRDVCEARSIKHWGVIGIDNPMWNKKGELNPRWKGGVTPERQLFYQSQEWKSVCSLVWKRDKATCQRCGVKKKDDAGNIFHIHHIASFANKELRANLTNLILMCETCHWWVHSKKNKNNEYLQEG